MAYEYERINNIGCVTSPISTDQAVEELQEVYRKAQAFDEITKLEKQTSLYSVVGKEDVELGIEIRKIINKYNDRYKECADDE
ncbi:hypothetical protein AB6G74_09520 [Staphylococcus ureilyticus]|uniref:hypothetical protein n=1 Tax=Staphylococcus ureilyticus TaxID=94138 RepID=UPI0034DD7086